MAGPTVWRSIVDATKAHIAAGPADPESIALRINELRRGAPPGFASQAINEALYELGLESRASA